MFLLLLVLCHHLCAGWRFFMGVLSLAAKDLRRQWMVGACIGVELSGGKGRVAGRVGLGTAMMGVFEWGNFQLTSPSEECFPICPLLPKSVVFFNGRTRRKS